jgi:MarR family transcriptional regulator, organic hydroperoxide resistance regulator
MSRKSPSVTGQPTATRPALLADGSDEQLRKLIYGLFTVGDRLTAVRRHLGRRLGISGPQFTVLTAIEETEGDAGVTVGDVARHLHVSSPFVVAESRKLAASGLVEKRADESDARIARLRLTREGRRALAGVVPELQRINDTFFDVADSRAFLQVCATVDRFVAGSAAAIDGLGGDSR